MSCACGQIRAVSFDVGGTLLSPRGSVGQVYAEIAAEWGFRNLPPEILRQRFRAAWRARPIFNHSRAEWSELVDAAFAGFVPVAPSWTFFGALYRRFAFPQAWEIFPDVLPALRALRKRDLKAQHDVYAMIVAGFGVWYVSLFYLVGVGLLCVHLSHGIQAMFQSLGLRNAAYADFIAKASKVIALVLFLGYASIPTSVMVFGHGKAYLKDVAKNTPISGEALAQQIREAASK